MNDDLAAVRKALNASEAGRRHAEDVIERLTTAYHKELVAMFGQDYADKRIAHLLRGN